MKKSLLSSLLAAALLLVTAGAGADGLKIAVIDLQTILQKSSQVKVINDKLTSQFKPRQDKIIAAQKSLQAEMDRLDKNGTTMAAADRNKLQDQIITDKANLQGMAIAFQRDLSAAQNQSLQDFMNQLNKVVTGIAQTNKYDLVLQRNGVPYVSSNLDISNQVLTELNKKSA